MTATDTAFAEWAAASLALEQARIRFEAACIALYAANHPEDAHLARVESSACDR